MIAHDSSNERASFTYHPLSLTIIDYHVPFDQGLRKKSYRNYCGQNNAMNQSELEANTCNQRQARENTCEQVMIDFGFAFHWLKKLCSITQYNSKLNISQF